MRPELKITALLCLVALPLVSCRSSSSKAALAGAVPGTIQVTDTNAPAHVGKKNADPDRIIQRSHLRINNADAEKDFLELVRQKNNTLADISTVERLITEKRAEIAGFEKTLFDTYGIDPERRYNYDRTSMIIYELKDPETNSPPDAPKPDGDNADSMVVLRSTRQLHKQLTTRQEAADFIRLTSSKRLSSQQIQALSLIVQEKQIALAKFDEALMAEFAVSRDRMYRYDSKTRTLYELIPVPAAGTPTGDAPARKN